MPGFISAVSCSRSRGCGGCCSASGSGNHGRWYYGRWWGWLANNAIWDFAIIATIVSVAMVMWSMGVISIVMTIVTPPAVIQSEAMSMTMSPEEATVGKNSLRCEKNGKQFHFFC